MISPTPKRHSGIRMARNGLSKYVESREAYVVGGIDESVRQDLLTGANQVFLSLVTRLWRPGTAYSLPLLKDALANPQGYGFEVTNTALQPVNRGKDILPFWGEGIVELVRQYNEQQGPGRMLKLLFVDGGNHRNLSLQERLDAEGVKARFERRNGHGYRKDVHALLPYLLTIADRTAMSFRIASEKNNAQNR